MTARSCQAIGCSACCVTHKIKSWPEDLVSVTNAMFEPCAHLCSDGCAVYPGRPFGCRSFKCLWLQDWFADDHNPLAVGIVVDGVHKLSDGTRLFTWWEYHEGALDTEAGQALFWGFVHQLSSINIDYAVIFRSRTGKSIPRTKSELETGIMPTILSPEHFEAMLK